MEQLAALIGELTPCEGSQATAVPELWLTRWSTTQLPRGSVGRALLCVVAQGSKQIQLGAQSFRYDPGEYLLVSLDLPLVGQILEASRRKPLLCMSLVLDFGEIAALMSETVLPPQRDRQDCVPVAVHPLDEDLLDALLRLVCLVKKPQQIPVLGPMIRREIYYKLLLGRQSGLLRRLTLENGKVQRIAKGLEWLRRHVAEPVRMEELARETGMSVSAMYAWFRAVTRMSPLQYQKQLRLQHARRLMLTECLDACVASRLVGYASASQFSREYRRLFGAPPVEDVERLRAMPLRTEG